MTTTPQNIIRPFLLESAGVRGRFVRLESAAATLLARHDYPPLIKALLADVLALTTAVAGALKFDGILTVQMKGEGAVQLVVADVITRTDETGTAAIDLRATARCDQAALAPFEAEFADSGALPSIPRLFGKGYLAFTVDQGELTDRYQGIVELDGATLTECVSHYFAQSDQFQMALKLATTEGAKGPQVGALVLQRLPETGGTLGTGNLATSEEYEDGWRRTVILMGTATNEELTDPAIAPDSVLFRLFHEEGVRVFDPVDVRDACRCDADRLQNVIMSLSPEERTDIAVDGQIAANCEFCNKTYSFDIHGKGIA